MRGNLQEFETLANSPSKQKAHWALENKVQPSQKAVSKDKVFHLAGLAFTGDSFVATNS